MAVLTERLAPPGWFVWFVARPTVGGASLGEIVCPRFGLIASGRCVRTQRTDGCRCSVAVEAAESKPAMARLAAFCSGCGVGPLVVAHSVLCPRCSGRANGRLGGAPRRKAVEA